MEQKSFAVTCVKAVLDNSNYCFEVWIRLKDPAQNTRIKLGTPSIRLPRSHVSYNICFPGGPSSCLTDIGGYVNKRDYRIYTPIKQSVYNLLMHDGVIVRFPVAEVAENVQEYTEQIEVTLVHGLWRDET